MEATKPRKHRHYQAFDSTHASGPKSNKDNYSGHFELETDILGPFPDIVRQCPQLSADVHEMPDIECECPGRPTVSA